MSLNNLIPIGHAGRESQGASSRVRTDPQIFKTLFETTVQNQAAVLAPGSAPLSKSQILEIINNVRTQMDARLIQALTEEGPRDIEAGCLGFVDRLALPPQTDSSNKQQVNQNNDVPDKLEAIIQQAAQTHGVDPALVRSVIKAESNFNSNSTSPKGAMGLMQLMPGTARELGVQNAYDPVENVQAGTRYLKTLLNRYDGNVQLALAAYNWGMGNLERGSGKLPAETRQYVDTVTRYYKGSAV